MKLKDMLVVLVGGLCCSVSAEETDIWAAIVDDSRPQGLITYDVGDYVQDGLVAHFDGIRNAGADAAHDPAATTWKNLVAGGPDAEFFKSSDVAATEPGHWTSNGYFFPGTCFAQMKDACVALGKTPTFQLAVDVDYRVQPAGVDRYPNLFAAPNDFCIYFNNDKSATRSSVLIWKTQPYAMANASGRAQLSWTDGKYVTAMLDEERQYLFSGTVRTGGANKPRTAFDAVAAQKWTWGGSASGPVQRYLIGTVHSVRIYNRELSEEELVWNRMVDNMRFHGTGGNVEVQTSQPGAEGVEVSGGYGVNGTYTFTTPASATVGEATYAPAGHQLEVWNTLSNVWEFAEVSDATTFTYTNCVARPRVRLTWLWRMTGGQVRLDADAYASLGLVANWDGIRNAGLGAAHDTAATTWKNSVAGGVDAERNPITKDGVWEQAGYRFLGGDAWKTEAMIDLGDNFTVQLATDFRAAEQNESNYNGAGTTYPSLIGTTGDVGNIYSHSTGSTLTYKCLAIVGDGTRATVSSWDGKYVTGFVAFDRTALTTGTVLPSFLKGDCYNKPIGPRIYYLGGVPMGETPAQQSLRCMNGTMYAARAYARILTPVEVAWNRFVDDVRFRGVHTIAATGLVAVAGTAVTGYGANDGVYLMRDGTRTFTAPASVTRDGARYVCTGYRLETFDPVLRSATNVVTQADTTTCTLTADTTVNRRIVWLWRTESRLRTVADYDVDDYVQAGLVAHYDGIRNVSPTLPHDSSLSIWYDLSEQKNRLTFHGTVSDGG